MTRMTTAEKYMDVIGKIQDALGRGRIREVEELGSTVAIYGIQLNQEVRRLGGVN